MTTDLYDDDVPPALGTVVEQDRGSLPFALIHGEALVACAGWALGESGVTPVDVGTNWAGLVDAAEPFVLHDALCPLTPPEFIAACVAEAIEHEAVVVGVRPVTDTVKHVEGGLVGETVDRAGLLAVASPVVLPGSVVVDLEALPSTDFAVLVAALAERYPVRTLEAPPSGRRVASEEDVRVLEALTSPEGVLDRSGEE
ncbi:2-C-methyl-D-erythritol 4-phosphate cytidylyltransferase [Nocardioides sp. W7]|uniref:2-C-methyl-D-erythritol 4-phosphate cytidylyltransferase n=1 Tax=Nocardioides sp. W7 TaxID=2931390 RepID=UPI001FD0EE8E|nr:2-C-methyl-D-erythritol 4-phosphate cytidylyltransferase [Nocardioides sp. W7]